MSNFKILIFLFISITIGECRQNYENKTYAGAEIFIEAAPYTVFITTGCTGALINRNFVISAKHCFSNGYQNRYVKFGANDLKEYQYYIRIEQVHYHPYADEVDNDLQYANHYDLALVELSKPAVLSSYVQILPLELTPWPNGPEDSRTCQLAGYGDNIYKNTKLHQSSFYVTYGQSTCNCETGTAESLLCTRAAKQGDSPCFGDSGGVLVCDSKGVAVLSMAFECTVASSRSDDDQMSESPCGKGDYYFVFTYIQPNLDWIESLSANVIDKHIVDVIVSNSNRRLHVSLFGLVLSCFGLVSGVLFHIHILL